MATKEYFDRVQEMSKHLKGIFARDRFKYETGTEDYIIRAVDEAAEQCVQADGAYWLCKDCGQRNDVKIKKCEACGKPRR